ncbi:MAG: nitroreductase family protein [Phycisphaerae bacterium]|jgi:nitroreductase
MNVLEAIRNRRSVRRYLDKPLPADVMEQMRQVLRWAPSACNNQPWRFIFVTDPALRREVAQASRGQMWMADAAVTVVGCGLADRAYKKMGGSGNSVELDLAIALDHLSLAAVAEGLGTCWIGAFDESKVKELLGVPEEVKVVAMMLLGYPASATLNGPADEGRRKGADEIFCVDRYEAQG